MPPFTQESKPAIPSGRQVTITFNQKKGQDLALFMKAYPGEEEMAVVCLYKKGQVAVTLNHYMAVVFNYL